MRVEITPRQKEVLDLLVGGMRGNDIADLLGIDKETVGSHMNNLRLAFGEGNMIAIAYRYGSVPSDVVVVYRGDVVLST